MIILEPALISEDLLEKHFICDLSKCKGACCVEGEFGAPLGDDELEIIEAEMPHILPYLNQASQSAIEKKGFFEKDTDGDIVTTCLPSGECNFSYKDENGILSCGIEKAWKEGKTTFRKPISCHLYPIRVSKVGEFDALNYHRWDICKPACKLGDKHKVAIYEFLKEPLIRKFGEAWYVELDKVAQALKT